jgi:hypothetical protein
MLNAQETAYRRRLAELNKLLPTAKVAIEHAKAEADRAKAAGDSSRRSFWLTSARIQRQWARSARIECAALESWLCAYGGYLLAVEAEAKAHALKVAA